MTKSAGTVPGRGVPARGSGPRQGVDAPVARAGIETVAGWLPGYARQIDEGTYPVLDAALIEQLRPPSKEHE